jgi:hypothetical protein
MRECNICKKKKKESKFKHTGKKTCMRCEFRWKKSFLRLLVQDRRLAPYILSSGNVGPIIYVLGGLISIPQVWLAKQWNLVAVNINVMIGYTIYLYNA